MQQQFPGQRHLSRLDLAVHEATRAYATGLPIPPPPVDRDWIDRADHHGVLEALVSGLEGQGLSLDAELSMVKLRVSAEHERAARDLAWMVEVLDAAGLPWVMVKGPVLAWEVYPRPDARSFCDLDVLVDPSDFGAALHALESAGAELLDRNWQAARELEVAELSLRLPLGSSLDLHWHLANRLERRRGFSIRTAELLARRRIMSLRGIQVPALDGPDMILHLAVHGAHSGGHLLRWLLDLHQTIRYVKPDHEELAERSRQQGTDLVARVMIQRAADYLDPSLATTASALAPRQPWAVVAQRWSRRFPPGCGDDGGLSGRALFQNVSSGSWDSARRLLTGSLVPGRLPQILRPAIRTAESETVQGGSVLRARDGGSGERAAYLELVRRQG